MRNAKPLGRLQGASLPKFHLQLYKDTKWDLGATFSCTGVLAWLSDEISIPGFFYDEGQIKKLALKVWYQPIDPKQMPQGALVEVRFALIAMIHDLP